jgi:phosphoribosyl-AMP cyclohydrolase
MRSGPSGKIRLRRRAGFRDRGAMDFDFKFTADGLIPAIVQEAVPGAEHPTGRILMFAWLNRESLEKSMETGLMHYWSRSRGKLWLKGETSGHTQRIVRWFHDCDRDVLLFEVEQQGGACHTGYRSCFYQELDRQAQPLPIREEKSFDDGKVYSA